MYRLILDCGLFQIQKSVYLPECANLISVAKLDDLGFNVKFGNNVFSLFKQECCYGSETLSDGYIILVLMLIQLNPCFIYPTKGFLGW